MLQCIGFSVAFVGLWVRSWGHSPSGSHMSWLSLELSPVQPTPPARFRGIPSLSLPSPQTGKLMPGPVQRPRQNLVRLPKLVGKLEGNR